MTNLTKNEKLLREGNEKWKKFLKEGAFAQQEETLEEGGTMGEYGKMDAEQGLPPTKIGRGNEEYMAAYNAVLQARGEEPLDMQQPDQAYLDALRSGQLEEQEKEADPRVVAMQRAMDLLEDLQFDSLESALDNMNTEVVRKLGIMLKQLDYNRNQVGNIQETEKKNLEEALPPHLAKFFDDEGNLTPDAAERIRKYREENPNPKSVKDVTPKGYGPKNEGEGKFQVGEFVYIIDGGLRGATGEIVEPTTLVTGEQGYVIRLYSDADKKVFGQQGDEVIAGASVLQSGGTRAGMELYDIDEKNLKEASYVVGAGPMKGAKGVYSHLENGMAMIKLTVADKDFGNIGDLIAVHPDNLRKDIDENQEKEMMAKMSNKELYKYLTHDKFTVPNLKGDMGPIPGLEGPFQYKSGAVLYYDPREGKYYDRRKDMYLDNDEALAHIMEDRTTMSSDPEMDQIEDIALTVIEKFGGLMSIATALKAQGFDASVSNGALSIDGKYFMGKADNFDISPDEDVRKVGDYVLGFMG